MTEVSIENRDDGVLLLVGDLSFKSVPNVLKQSKPFLNVKNTQLDVDLSGVTRSDSAGIGLLIEWMKMTVKNNTKIRFLNIPDQMLEIARVSGLDDVIPLMKL